MSIKNRKVFIWGLGVLSCLGLYCGILFWPEEVPAIPPGFDQTDCEKPCWYNLQVGISKKQDVRNVLGTLVGDSNQIQIEEGEYSSGNFIRIEFRDTPITRIASFDFEENGDDVVDYIYLSDMLVMGQVFKAFGEPDGVILISHPTIHPNYWKKSIHLYYSKKGLTIGCYEGTTLWNADGSPCKSEADNVTLGFFDPNHYRDFLDREYGNADLAMEYMQPYNGLSAEYPIFVATPMP